MQNWRGNWNTCSSPLLPSHLRLLFWTWCCYSVHYGVKADGADGVSIIAAKIRLRKYPKHLSNYSYTTLKPSTFPNIMVLLCWKDRETRPHLGIWHSSNEPRLKYLTRNRETRHFQSQKAQDRGNDSRTTVVSSMFNYCWWKGHFVQLTSEGGLVSDFLVLGCLTKSICNPLENFAILPFFLLAFHRA